MTAAHQIWQGCFPDLTGNMLNVPESNSFLMPPTTISKSGSTTTCSDILRSSGREVPLRPSLSLS